MTLRRCLATTLTALLCVLACAMPADAQNGVLLKLIGILRDRGSISAEEYEELRLAAESEATGDAPVPALSAPPLARASETNGDAHLASPADLAVTGAPATLAVAAPPAAAGLAATGILAAVDPGAAETVAAHAPSSEAQAARRQPEVARTASPARWYDRLGLRGYTQFRYTRAEAGADGTLVDVPADRSVSPSETFGIRRGRFILSGDLSDHVFLYAQPDVSASNGGADFSLQMRDLYADIALDASKAFRVRVGQSKVPFGWVNMQSSQNRGPAERPDALNSAVEGERDLGAYLMWAPPEARQRFRDLVAQGLKGSGDYGVVTAGAYAGQGLNRSDQNGSPHWIARAAYPFKLPSGQFFELGVQAYRGRFVSPTQAVLVDGHLLTPERDPRGVEDARVAATAVWYPQPLGVEAEWTIGRGPALTDDFSHIRAERLRGGYVQVGYRKANGGASFYPFVRWQYFDGARKFARNAPRTRLNELDFGVEVARWADVEVTMTYTRTFQRTNTSLFPYRDARGVNRLGVQVQWNY